MWRDLSIASCKPTVTVLYCIKTIQRERFAEIRKGKIIELFPIISSWLSQMHRFSHSKSFENYFIFE